jgi:hypothetical protein
MGSFLLFLCVPRPEQGALAGCAHFHCAALRGADGALGGFAAVFTHWRVDNFDFDLSQFVQQGLCAGGAQQGGWCGLCPGSALQTGAGIGGRV